jgi:hypothetical protein
MSEILCNGLHNGGGTGNASNQAVSSGTYTPTFSNLVNCSALSAGGFKWIRVGNCVSFVGKVTATITTVSTITNFEFTLPIATSTANASGSANSAVGSFGVVADVSGNGQVYLPGVGAVNGTQVLYISGGYEIV